MTVRTLHHHHHYYFPAYWFDTDTIDKGAAVRAQSRIAQWLWPAGMPRRCSRPGMSFDLHKKRGQLPDASSHSALQYPLASTPEVWRRLLFVVTSGVFINLEKGPAGPGAKCRLFTFTCVILAGFCNSAAWGSLQYSEGCGNSYILKLPEKNNKALKWQKPIRHKSLSDYV